MFRRFEGRHQKRWLGFTWKDKISNARFKGLTGLGDIKKEVYKRY
jgi:hypothetical protein